MKPNETRSGDKTGNHLTNCIKHGGLLLGIRAAAVLSDCSSPPSVGDGERAIRPRSVNNRRRAKETNSCQ
ncbi:MAG: hypothetical protein ABSH34_01630 [Verrucomicrobiota bacterium]